MTLYNKGLEGGTLPFIFLSGVQYANTRSFYHNLTLASSWEKEKDKNLDIALKVLKDLTNV